MFITTANNRHQIPLPLQDRLEIIELPGYTAIDKARIAHDTLFQKQPKRNGLEKARVVWQRASVQNIIDGYTRESGVRSLEREIASVCRKVAEEAVAANHKDSMETFKRTVTAKSIRKYLGKPKFKHGVTDPKDEIGLVNGLAYTSGRESSSDQCTVVPEKVSSSLPQLGDVMQESAQAALSYVRSRGDDLALSQIFIKS